MKIEPERMKAQASRASTLLGAMSNDKRLMILCQLISGERTVNELAELLDTRQSTVSQHLALLRRDGFVQPRRDGQTQYYSLAGDEARSILETLYTLYCDPARKDS
jgi:DNA-binding transcriptional ArsR family regulator